MIFLDDDNFPEELKTYMIFLDDDNFPEELKTKTYLIKDFINRKLKCINYKIYYDINLNAITIDIVLINISIGIHINYYDILNMEIQYIKELIIREVRKNIYNLYFEEEDLYE